MADLGATLPLRHIIDDRQSAEANARPLLSIDGVGEMHLTGFLKQETHSVGVQRQYTGSAGRIANSQVGTSLVVTTRTMGIDFDLYLPRSWTDDAPRRREARIPADVEFKTKPQQAIDMIRRAVEAGIATGVVLADCGFGDSNDFRDGARTRVALRRRRRVEDQGVACRRLGRQARTPDQPARARTPAPAQGARIPPRDLARGDRPEPVVALRRRARGPLASQAATQA